MAVRIAALLLAWLIAALVAAIFIAYLRIGIPWLTTQAIIIVEIMQ